MPRIGDNVPVTFPNPLLPGTKKLLGFESLKSITTGEGEGRSEVKQLAAVLVGIAHMVNQHCADKTTPQKNVASWF